MNAAYEWWRYRNPLRMLFTSFIVELTCYMPPCGLKNNLLRMIGIKIGKDVSISPFVRFDWLFPECIEIGDGTLIGADVWIACHSLLIDEIRVGRVKIGKQVMIGSWFCNEPPTIIGDRAIFGVYTYANKDVPSDSFVVGIPMQIKKDLKEMKYLEEFNKGLAKFKRR